MQTEQAAAALINGTFHCKCMARCIWLNHEGLLDTRGTLELTEGTCRSSHPVRLQPEQSDQLSIPAPMAANVRGHVRAMATRGGTQVDLTEPMNSQLSHVAGRHILYRWSVSWLDVGILLTCLMASAAGQLKLPAVMLLPSARG